jgi:hypothetical protein
LQNLPFQAILLQNFALPKMKKFYLLTYVLVLVTVVAEAQSFYAIRRSRSLIVSAGTGTATYFGELKDKGGYIDPRVNLNAGLQYFVMPELALRGELGWFQLAGDDANEITGAHDRRNLSFVSSNFEASVTGALHLKPMNYRYYQRPPFNAYAYAGLGLLYFNPKTELNGEMHSLRPLMTEDVAYSRTQIVIPFGAGVKVKAGPFFNLVLEGGYRKTFTDYLDDVSTVHPDKSTWTDPVRIALSDRSPEVDSGPFAPGHIRGNPEKKDGYFLMNFKVEYYLPTTFAPNNRPVYRKKRRPYNR